MDSPQIAVAMLGSGPSRPRAGRRPSWSSVLLARLDAWLHATRRRGSTTP